MSTVTEDEVSLTFENQSLLKTHGHQPETGRMTPVKTPAGPSLSQEDIFTDLSFKPKEEVKQAMGDRSGASYRNSKNDLCRSNRLQTLDSNSRKGHGPTRNSEQRWQNQNENRSNTPNSGPSPDSKNKICVSNNSSNDYNKKMLKLSPYKQCEKL